jgi:hypothetical protein
MTDIRGKEPEGELPTPVRELADKNFELLKYNPQHPSRHSERADRFFSARVGLSYRTLGVEVEDGALWFWIGSHADYDKIVG